MSDIVVAGSTPVMPKASQSKSIIRQYADLLTAHKATDLVRSAEHSLGTDHVSAFFDAFGRTSGGMTTGGIYGALAHFDMMDPGGAPLDALGSLVGNVAGIVMARSGIGASARNFASHAACIFAFRKTQEMLKEGKAFSFTGEDDEVSGPSDEDDEILNVAKSLG